MKNNNSISGYIKEHFLQLIIIIGGFLVSFTILRSQVAANAEKVDACMEIIASYPSEQYFDLRFAVIEKRLDKLEVKIESLNNK